MKRTRHTPEQVSRKLREADGMLAEGKGIAEVAKELGVSDQTARRGRRRLSPKNSATACSDGRSGTGQRRRPIAGSGVNQRRTRGASGRTCGRGARSIATAMNAASSRERSSGGR